MNYIHLIDRLSTNEMLLKFNNIDHSTDEKERVTIIAKMRENKNKATNRGVIPLFAEPYEIEWTCSERQRVEMKMNEINEWIAFPEGWKVNNFSGSEKPTKTLKLFWTVTPLQYYNFPFVTYFDSLIPFSTNDWRTCGQHHLAAAARRYQ